MRAASVAAAAALAFVSTLAPRVNAAPTATDADALFKSAKALRDSGKVTEACIAFEKSKRLEPGVGVALYLADCYERLGRTASAWTQFREAEKLARERKDKRVDVAHAHAAKLESQLTRVVIVVAPAIRLDGAELRIDDAGPVPQSDWKSGVAADPGDHSVTLAVPGATTRTAKVHVDAASRAVTVIIEDPPPVPVVPLPVAPVAPAATSAPPVESTVPVGPSTRSLVGYGLLGAGAVGVGFGAAFLAAKNQSMSNNGPGGMPQVNQGDNIASTVAFAAGGAALVSAIILYLSTPAEKETALIVTPAPIPGGGGAFVRASF